MPTPTMQKSSSGTMQEVPTSFLDETTVVVVLTTGTIVAPITAITEKVGIGGMTTVMTSEASALVTTTTR